MDQGSTMKRSAVHNFAPTVTKFCVMWEGQALPHDTKFGNSRCEIVCRRVIFIWSLIHGSSWSGLIKVGPGLNVFNHHQCLTHCAPCDILVFTDSDYSLLSYQLQAIFYIYTEQLRPYKTLNTWNCLENGNNFIPKLHQAIMPAIWRPPNELNWKCVCYKYASLDKWYCTK